MPAMTRPKAGFAARRSLPLALLAHAIVTLVLVSCAGGSGQTAVTSVVQPTLSPTTPVLRPTATPPPTQPPEPSPSPTEAPSTEPTQQTTTGVTHTVEPGDTLLGLARAYDVPMAAIQLQNHMGDSTIIQVGQTLSVPPGEEWDGSSHFWVVHQVSAGETLIAIARTYGVEPDALQAVNGLGDVNRLAVDQNLVLPLTGPAPPRAPVVASDPGPTSTPQPPAAVAAVAAVETPDATEIAEAAPATEVPQAPVAPSGPPADLAPWPREIARLINEVRAQHGLEPLRYNETLEQAAQAHADDCTQRGWCSHTGSDGSNIKTRVRRAGYDASGWAECWAQTQSPSRAVEIWMDEVPPNDPHRRTLLSDWFSEIGIGVSESDWGHYIIADFGRP